MSRKYKKASRPPVRKVAQDKGAAASLTSKVTFDQIVNQYMRMGGGENLLENNNYSASRITDNYAMLNSMYRSDWIANRLIDTIPEDMTKNWYKLTCSVQPGQIKEYENVERKTRLSERILEGLKWGRLYGGAAGVMIIEGQEDQLDQPLVVDEIMPGAFKGLLIADRWNGVYPSMDLVDDISDPDFGLPEYYRFTVDEKSVQATTIVHHSRVIRFTGRQMPLFDRQSENYWGVSEIQHVFQELNKRNSTSANIAQLVFQAHLRILKMEDLGQELAFGDSSYANDLYNTLEAQNKLMNNMSLQVMSKDDDFQTFQYTFSGLSDIYQLFMNDISGACEIPSTKLFGRAPAGMNATGESDLTNYYDTIRKWQEAQLRPIIEKLMPIIAVSAWGAVPDDMGFEFNPIRDTSDEERANLIQQTAGAINSIFQSGIISQKTALKELKDAGAVYGMWNNITDEDIENADDGTQPQGGEGGMPGMGDMGGMMPDMGAMGGAPDQQEQPMEMPQQMPEEPKKNTQANDENSASVMPQNKGNKVIAEKQEKPQNANLMAQNANKQQNDSLGTTVAGVGMAVALVNVLKKAIGLGKKK